jgi:ankyrin repeat protein
LKQKQIEVGTYFLSLKEISETELNIAIEAGSLKTVQFILEKKPELQILLHNNQELFLQALSTRQADLIQFFFDQGIVLDKKQPQVIQTLFDAVERKNKLLLNCLIKNGADPNSTTESGWTLLSQAVFENDLEMVKYLHLKGAELDLNDGSALFNAALGDDRFETLKYLIDNGAKVNIKDQKGFFPLFASSATGSFNNVKYLIEHGADPTLKNHQGETVLMNEWPCGNLELIEYLMQHGADIDAQDNAGRSVFDHFSACMQSHMVNRGLVKSEYVYFPPEIWED